MASLIVLLPIYMLLMWFIRKDAVRDPSRNAIWVRRWALILTLFVAGTTIAVDLIMLLPTFLNGEALTLAFVLKVVVIFVVALKCFLYFIADLKGYWERFPMRKRMADVGIGVAAVIVIVAGFFIVGTPAQARLARFDEQKVSDLQNIQYQIINFYQAKQKLPGVITDLNNSLDFGSIPVDPQSGEPYVYKPGEGLSFELCADFNKESRTNRGLYENQGLYETRPMAVPAVVGGKGMLQDNWQHSAGSVCFE